MYHLDFEWHISALLCIVGYLCYVLSNEQILQFCKIFCSSTNRNLNKFKAMSPLLSLLFYKDSETSVPIYVFLVTLVHLFHCFNGSITSVSTIYMNLFWTKYFIFKYKEGAEVSRLRLEHGKLSWQLCWFSWYKSSWRKLISGKEYKLIHDDIIL